MLPEAIRTLIPNFTESKQPTPTCDSNFASASMPVKRSNFHSVMWGDIPLTNKFK